MLPVYTGLLTAAGASAWIPLNFEQHSFAASVAIDVLSGTLEFKVQYGMYDPSRDQEDVKSITRSTTTATMTWFAARAAKAADSIVVTGAGAPLDGTYDIATVTSSTVITYTVANSGAAANLYPGPRCQLIRTFDDPTITGKTATIAGAVPFVADAVRLVITSYTSGGVQMIVNQGR
jgi:hypothetical protein